MPAPRLPASRSLNPLADGDFLVTSLRFATACGTSPRLRLDLVLNDTSHAHDHVPQVTLEEAVTGLVAGLSAVNFKDPDFRNSNYMLKRSETPVALFTEQRRMVEERMAKVSRGESSLIGEEEANCITIYAVAHHARRPDYWRNRAEPGD